LCTGIHLVSKEKDWGRCIYALLVLTVLKYHLMIEKHH